LLYERFDSTHTPYDGTRVFLPGTLLRYREGRSAWHTYFDLLRDLDSSAVAETSRRFADSTDRFEDGLVRSVERHLLSDVPVATMCSGGLDSGLVTVIAARQLNGLVSYVADIEGMHGEEVRRASLVAESAGAKLRPVRVDRTRFLTALPDAIKANDQPMFFAQDVAAMLIAEQIQRDGFKVVLTGDGADELFGGYSWYEQEYRRWARLAWKARWIPDNALTRTLGARVSGLMPVDLAREQAAYRLTAEPVEYVSTSFNIAFAGGMNRTLRQRAIFSKLAGLPPPERAFLSRNFEDVYVHLRECLNTLDKMTMRHSIEARVPFLENDLMKLGFALPVDHKYHDGQRKRLVYQLGRKLLPEAVIGLPKIGFTMPDAMWRGLETLLLSGRTAELLDWPTAYREDLAQLLSRKPRYLFRLLGFEMWLRVCVDGQPTKSLANELLAAAHLI
jgi:asparagine synthase (glutamine-hydrolysing)